jgi:hypothetical protein
MFRRSAKTVMILEKKKQDKGHVKGVPIRVKRINIRNIGGILTAPRLRGQGALRV